MNFSKRVVLPELIDLGPEHYTPEEYRDCMIKLGRVGRLLGGDQAGLAAFRTLKEAPKSILDVGCGGGWFTRKLAKAFPGAEVVGEDFSGAAIQLAEAYLSEHPIENLRFRKSPALELEAEENSVDVVTATLVCHHMEDGALVEFLRRAKRAARRAVIINDLHRHRLAHASFRLVAPMLFNNRLIRNDGPLSVRKGFSKSELEGALAAAGISDFRIRWRWAFRWILHIDCES